MQGSWVECFIIPVPEERLEEYKKLAVKTARVFRELGALEYVECISDNTKPGQITSFPRAVQAKDDEKIVLAWVTYSSKEQWQEVHKKFLEHPVMQEMTPDNLPFDGKRMIIGGFDVFLSA